jgi:hypothetical protein
MTGRFNRSSCPGRRSTMISYIVVGYFFPFIRYIFRPLIDDHLRFRLLTFVWFLIFLVSIALGCFLQTHY